MSLNGIESKCPKWELVILETFFLSFSLLLLPGQTQEVALRLHHVIVQLHGLIGQNGEDANLRKESASKQDLVIACQYLEKNRQTVKCKQFFKTRFFVVKEMS